MQLDHQDKSRLGKFFARALRDYGINNPKAVRWEEPRDQRARFETLCEIGDLAGRSILDVGCGLGDLYPFLESRFRNFTYLGIDLLPEMVAAARQKYPGGQFEVADVYSVRHKFDYVLASGALSFNVAPGKKFYFDMIARMFELCNKGLAFNMLDSDYYSADRDFLVYNPQELIPVAERLTPNFQIIVGYTVGDFTVYLYR